VRHGTAGRCRPAQHGGDTGNQKKVITMTRPVRILLAAVALIAVGVAGWAFGNGDSGSTRSAADTTAQAAEPQAGSQGEPAAASPDPAPDASAAPPTTRPAPRPRIFGFGSEPVYPQEGGFWQLPPGPGEAVLITDARYATKVEFLLTPTGTGTAGQSVSLGVDTDGSDAYTARWRYPDRPLLAHLVVRATGLGGSTDEVVGVYHPDPAERR
jgi:hypothetical protein